MAIISGGFSSYLAIGNREDLSDIIHNIAPVENWLVSNSGETKATQRYHEWQTDTLATPAANAQFEGNDYSATIIVPTTRLGNYTQILAKTFAITRTQEVTDKAGRKSELAYQTGLKLKELANDIEYALIVNSASASGATGTARQLKGALGWISTNNTTASATTVFLTEALVQTNLQLIWAAGGKPQHIVMGAVQKTKFDAFTGNNTRFLNMMPAQVQSAVEVYKSSFGNVTAHLHFILNQSTGASTGPSGNVIIFGDMSLWRKAYLRKAERIPLAVTGSSLRFLIETELTLECGNELGAGKVSALAPA
jgi:hypothetical protein